MASTPARPAFATTKAAPVAGVLTPYLARKERAVQLLLVFLFAMAALGLYTERMSGRLNLTIAAIVVMTTALYYGATRFMS